MVTEPDLHSLGLSLWVKGRELPNATDFWDSNWLVVRAEMRASGAYVEREGPILTSTDIEQFRDDLSAMVQTLSGGATLSGMEPGLALVVKLQKLGRVEAVVEITPDHITQQHRFEVEADQSFLPGLIAACDSILERFPVINAPSR